MSPEYVLTYIAQHSETPKGTTWKHLASLWGWIEHRGDGVYILTPEGEAEVERMGREALGIANR